MSVALTTDSLIPLSAQYPYSTHIDIKSTIAKWKDGYTTFNQPVFVSNVDCSTNNHSILYLTSSMNLFDILVETPLENVLLGDYIMLQINSQYVTNVDNELYLTTVSGNDSFFKLIANDDSTYSFLNGTGLYVTVSNQAPFDLTLESKHATDEAHHQSFNLQIYNKQVYITTNVINETGLSTAPEQRFWSYTKYGPEAGKLRANGTIQNNDYLFNISNFDVDFKPSGLTRDHTWVSYYNQVQDSQNNRNVEINETVSISGIKVNHLIDFPYNTTININSNSAGMNMSNMKTIQTSNYKYRKK